MEKKGIAARLEVLTEEEMAVLAGVSVDTIDDWRRRGNGPVHMKIGRECYYDIKDVRDFLLSTKKDRAERGREAILRALRG